MMGSTVKIKQRSHHNDRMRKKVGIIKRVSYIGLIFLLSINSFATIVSDNDGSAFITKAEFDALKSSFQAQIDTYNQSIDSKIDGAIAAYLAGIKLAARKQEVHTPPFDWTEVVFMNNSIAPTFTTPSWYSAWQWAGFSAATTGQVVVTQGNNNTKGVSLNGEFSYNKTWGSSETCLRPLFGLVSGSESSVGSLYWRGIAQRYTEYWHVDWTRIGTFGDIAWLGNSSSCYLYLTNVFHILANGYYSNLNTTSIMNPSTKWQSPSGTTADTNRKTVVSCTAEAGLGQVDGKTTDYDHIIQHKENTEWWLTNEDFTHTFYKHSSCGITDSSIYSATIKNTSNYYSKWCDGEWSSNGCGSGISLTYSNAGTRVSSIGMLNSSKAANQIYQFKDNINYVSREKNFPVNRCTLEKGFILGAALKDDEVIWPVEFSQVYAYNGSSYVTNAHEVDIYLSYVPFSDQTTTSDKIIFPNGSDHITTSGRKADVKFKMTKDSLIYVKCVPHLTSSTYVSSNDWHLRLDLSGVKNKYTIEYIVET